MGKSAAETESDIAKKAEVARGRNIGMAVAAVAMACWYGYTPVMKWWDRKGFESVVEKTLSERGIATAEDNPRFATVEHGEGIFNGRQLQASVVQSNFEQVDVAAGERTPRCIYMYGLIDKEFGVYRAMSMTDCSEPADLEKWKQTVKFR